MFDQYGTDYSKKSLELNALLPAINKSTASDSLLSTIFQRWLTKSNLTNVAGTIGATTSKGLTPSVVESTPIRQAYQLSPVFYSKQGVDQQVYDWEDILRKLSFTGVDTAKYPSWGTTRLFDFHPPISIDKFANYLNYYWVNASDTIEQPDYVTIVPNAIERNDWSAANKWVHKNELGGQLAYAKQAQLPIIEFDDIELSQWFRVNRVWKKLNPTTNTFLATSETPEWDDPELSINWELQSEHLIPVCNQELLAIPVAFSRVGNIVTIPEYLIRQNNVLVFTDINYTLPLLVTEIETPATYGTSTTLELPIGTPLTANLYIVIGPHHRTDIGKVPVLVKLADTFTSFTPVSGLRTSGQPEYRDLSLYKMMRQQRLAKYQLPLFNLYSLRSIATTRQDSTGLYDEQTTIGTIIQYKADLTQTVNTLLGQRIAINSGDLEFTTDLVSSDDQLKIFKSRDNPRGSTVWTNPDNTTFSPRYVDSERNTMSTDSPGGWEPSVLLTSNPLRETRAAFRFVDVIKHFQLLASNQPGTITIADDGGNYLISSLIAPNLSIPKQLQFIADEVHLFRVRMELTIKSILGSNESLKTLSAAYIPSFIYNELKQRAHTEGGANAVYDDTLSYDAATNLGYPKYPTTFGVLGLATPVYPSVEIDRKLSHVVLRTHDGAAHFINLSAVDTIYLENKLAKVLKVTPTIFPPPSNFCVWRKTSIQTYRFEAFYFSASQPSSPQTNQTWYNPTNELAQRWNGVTWVGIEVAALWKPFDIVQLIADTLLLQELDIFNLIKSRSTELVVAGNTNEVINWIQQLPNPTHLRINSTTVHDALERNFVDFCYQYLQQDPTQQVLSKLLSPVNLNDPFTWNYSDLNPTNPGESISTYELYTQLYNTPLPHKQPWAIQGCKSKPIWWDEVYADTTGTRVWLPVMWSNIRLGIIPTGKQLTNAISTVGTGLDSQLPQFSIIPVNTTSFEITGYQLDDLLPPMVDISAALGTLISSSHPTYIALTQCVLIDGTRQPSMLTFPSTPHSSNYLRSIWSRDFNTVSRALLAMYQCSPIETTTILHNPTSNCTVINGLTVVNHTTNVVKNTKPLHGADGFVDNSIFATLTFLTRSTGASSHDNSPLYTWKTWSTRLAYQTNGLVVPQTLRIYQDCTQINDFAVILKKSENISSIQFSNVIVTLNQIGTPNLSVPYSDWIFLLTCSEKTPTMRQRYAILEQDFTWVATALAFTPVGFQIRWNTGEEVVFATPPTGVAEYVYPSLQSSNKFFVRVANNLVQLHQTFQESVTGTNPIDFGDIIGTDRIRLRSINTTFSAGGRVWETAEVDRTDVISFNFADSITCRGPQSVIDFLVSYTEYMQDAGVVVNIGESTELDPDTNAVVSWHQQISKVVDTIYASNGLLSTSTASDRIQVTGPFVELNPFRNTINFNTPEGILCDFNHVPYAADTQSVAAVYDDTGSPLFSSELMPLRTDRITTVVFNDSLPPRPINISQDLARRIAFGRVSVDFYEHVVLLNQQASNGLTIFDRFFNLQKSNLTIEFQKSVDFFHRPVMGGFSVTQTETLPNFETASEYQRNDYNVAQSNELVQSTIHSRQMLGKVPLPYFDNIPVTSKTEFQFWQQMIKEKGTKGAISAFTRHRLYDSVEYDEYWAWKQGTFGAVEPRKQVELRITADETSRLAHSFWFASTEFATPTVSTAFPISTIEVLDQNRWINFPTYVDAVVKQPSGIDSKQGYAIRPYEITQFEFSSVISDLTGVEVLSDVVDSTSVILEYTRGYETFPYASNVFENGSATIQHNVRGDSVSPLYREYDIENLYDRTVTIQSGSKVHFPIDVQFLAKTMYYQAFVFCNGIMVPSIIDGFTVTLMAPVTIPTVLRLLITNHAPNEIAVNLDTINHAIVGVNFTIINSDNENEVVDLIDAVMNIIRSSGDAESIAAALATAPYQIKGTYVPLSPTDSTIVDMIDVVDLTPGAPPLVYSDLLEWADIKLSANPSRLPAKRRLAILTINGLLPTYATLSPLRVIDIASKNIVKTLPAWDPANGVHTQAMAAFDYVQSADPASYNRTLFNPVGSVWGTTQVGQYWLDSSTLIYKPYFDSKIFDFDKQTELWGELSDGSTAQAYQWVQSSFKPTISSKDIPLTRQITKTRLTTIADSAVDWVDIGSTQLFIKNPSVTATELIATGNTVVLYKRASISTPVDLLVGSEYTVTGTPDSFTLTDINGQLVSMPVLASSVGTTLFVADVWSGNTTAELTAILSKTFHNCDSSVCDITDLSTSGHDLSSGAQVTVNGITTAFDITVSATATIVHILNSEGDSVTIRPQDIVRVWYPDYASGTVGYPAIESNQLSYTETEIPYVEHVTVVNNQRLVTYYYWSANPTAYNPNKQITLSDAVAGLLAPSTANYFAARTDAATRVPMLTTWGLYGLPQVSAKALAIDLDSNLRDRYVNAAISKNINEQWTMFRKQQDHKPISAIWESVVATVTGVRVVDGISILVPNPDRASYDYLYGTTLSYGTSSTQTLISPAVARTMFDEFFSIRNLLIDPTLHSLVQTTELTTAILNKDYTTACNFVFDNFSAILLNTFVFNILHEGLYHGYEYDGLFKTSYVALQVSQKVVVGK